MGVNEAAVYLSDLECHITTIKSNPDIVQQQEVTQQPEKNEFIMVAEAKVNAHTENRLWKVVPRHCVPQGKLVSCGVWAMMH